MCRDNGKAKREILQRTQKVRDYGFFILGAAGLWARLANHETAATALFVVAIALAVPDALRIANRKRHG